MLNFTDSYHRLPAGLPLCTAEAVTLAEPKVVEQPNVPERVSINQALVSDMSNTCPSHLIDLRDRSSEFLSSEEIAELDNLFSEYQDVFAKDDFDLGNFHSISHKIDTGDAHPIKQKMRRTPINFADEEKAHLNKMLKVCAAVTWQKGLSQNCDFL